MADEALPIVLNAKIWIPEQYVDEDACEQFHRHLFFDANCEKCPFHEERGTKRPRPTEACLGDGETTCQNYFGKFDLHVIKESRGVTFHGFPYGNREALKEVYPDIFQHEPIQDQRPRPPFKHDIQFTATLKDFQEEATGDCLRRNGNLISKPRTGKTVMATWLICKTRLKTLILAGQTEWLKGFRDHFVGSKKQAAMTNIPMIREVLEQAERDERKRNRVAWNKKKMEHVIGFPETLEDYERLDICLVTYQQLIQVTEQGRDKLEAIKNMFGFVVIDEVDTANATEFATVVAQLNAAYKLGITATWDRKDGRQVLMEHLLGEKLHVTETPIMKPRVEVVESRAVTTHKNWNYFLRFLENDDTLFEELIENVLVDLENGHQILIPLVAVDHTIKVYKEINKRWGSLVAAPILGKTHMPEKQRDKVVERMQLGELRVLTGPHQLVKRGINIPGLSMLYEYLPSNNFPQAEQRLFRILTPDPNKQQPVIKYFLVNNKIQASCVKSEYYGYVLPTLNPDVSQGTVETLKAYFSRNLEKPRGGPLRGRI